jgi:hypothetical protein
MTFFLWCRLVILEQKLQFEFGKYNEYRRLCLDRKATSTEEKLPIAKQVLDGPSVNTMVAQANEIYLRKVEASRHRKSIQEIKGQPPHDDTTVKSPTGQKLGSSNEGFENRGQHL